MKKLAITLAIVLAVIIVVLLGLLMFVKPVQGPTISQAKNLQVDLPHPNDAVSSPVAIQGSVTGGGWFFEASFPIKVLDGDGKVIGTGMAQALSEWMSTGTVPFSASILFTAPHYATGTILFENDNPSGLPENAKSLSVPVTFRTAPVVDLNGTVQGKVVLEPTCPVESNPPNPQCAPKPYKTSIAISQNIQTSGTLKTIQTDASGAFSVALAPGAYHFQPKGGAVFPRCGEQLVTVKAGQTSNITISCDTGIR